MVIIYFFKKKLFAPSIQVVLKKTEVFCGCFGCVYIGY